MICKNSFFTLLFISTFGLSSYAQGQFCYQGATISVGGQTELSFSTEELGDSKIYRFRTRPLVNSYAYLVTDESNNVVQVSKTNFIDVATLGAGSFRVWSFSYIGDILVQPGDNAAEVELASFCHGLSANFVAINVVDSNAPRQCIIDPEFPTVAKAIGRNNLLQVLQRGLENAELGPALIVEGPLTVFAPVNNAFAKIPGADLDALFTNANGDLVDVMLNHVVEGCYTAADLVDGQVLTSISGGELRVSISEAGIFVNDAQVVEPNVGAANGVVHLITAVLQP